jgi:putative transferase (TIGR04331 family)
MDLPILITGAARPSHTIEFPYTSTLFKTYLQNQILISKIINQILNKKVTIRTREKNRGNQIENIIKEYKNLEFLSIDYQKNEFNKVLRNYSLHITDNTSTTILDSFILNFPTIIILDNTYFKLSDVAQFSFTGLEKVGIFHKNINSFSNHLVLTHVCYDYGLPFRFIRQEIHCLTHLDLIPFVEQIFLRDFLVFFVVVFLKFCSPLFVISLVH